MNSVNERNKYLKDLKCELGSLLVFERIKALCGCFSRCFIILVKSGLAKGFLMAKWYMGDLIYRKWYHSGTVCRNPTINPAWCHSILVDYYAGFHLENMSLPLHIVGAVKIIAKCPAVSAEHCRSYGSLFPTQKRDIVLTSKQWKLLKNERKRNLILRS